MHGDRYRNRCGLTGSFLGHTAIMPRGMRSIRLGIFRVEDWMVGSSLDFFLRVGVNVTSLYSIGPSTFDFRALMKPHALLAPGLDIAGLLLRMVKWESASFPSVSGLYLRAFTVQTGHHWMSFLKSSFTLRLLNGIPIGYIRPPDRTMTSSLSVVIV